MNKLTKPSRQKFLSGSRALRNSRCTPTWWAGPPLQAPPAPADAQSFRPSSTAPSPIPSLRALPRPVRNWSLLHRLLPHPAPSKASALSHLGSHWVVCLVIL